MYEAGGTASAAKARGKRVTGKSARKRWGLRLLHGPRDRLKRIDVYFSSKAAAFRWLSGLDALLEHSSFGVPREFKEYLLTVFKRADRDLSGTVNENELTELLSLLNIVMSESRQLTLTEAMGEHEAMTEGGLRFRRFFEWLMVYMRRADTLADSLYGRYAKKRPELGLLPATSSRGCGARASRTARRRRSRCSTRSR